MFKIMMRKEKRQLASTKLPPISFDKLPPDIARKLKQAASRIKFIIWMRGLLAVLAAAVIFILAIMAVDAMVMIYSSVIRWVLWGCGVVATTFTAMHLLVRPLAKPFTPGRIAALIEQNHPELEERLSTVVELLSNPGSAEVGSSQLMEVLTGDAINDVKAVSPKSEFTNKTVKPKLLVAACALAILSILFAIWPESTGRLIIRAVVPSAEVDNIYADNLGVTPGDSVVLIGQPLAIELAIYGGFPGQAYLRCEQSENGKKHEVVERMRQTSADESGKDHMVRYYQHYVADVKNSFRYRVSCGSALTRFYTVTAVPIPAYKSLEITSTFPAYTGIAPRTNAVDDMEINAVAGTEVAIRIVPERPLNSKLILADATRPAILDAKGNASWSFAMTDKTAGQWSIEMTDSYGFTNKPASFPIRLVKDQSPTIEIETPEKLSYTLPPFAKLPFSYVATDDFGIATPELRVSIDNAPFERLRDAVMTPVRLGVWRGDDVIDLAKIKANGAAHVRIQIAVRDNLPTDLNGPQEALSASFDITLDRSASSMAMQMMEEQFAAIDQANAAIMDALDKAKKNAQAGLDEIDRKSDSTAVTNLTESKKNIAKAEELIRTMMSNSQASLFEELVPEMQQLLNSKVEPAGKQADNAILTEAASRRPEVVRLIEILSEAIESAKAFSEKVEEKKEELEKMTEMTDLADKQSELAEKATEEMTPEEMEKWRQEQEKLKNEFDKAADEMTADEPLDAAKKKADELAGKVAALKEEQEKIKDLQDQLGDEKTKDQAAAELEKMTPDMPANTSPEDRAQQAQEDVAKQAEALQDEVSNMADDFKGLDAAYQEMTQPVSDPLSNAAQKMDAAQQDANQAAEEMKADAAKADEKMDSAAKNLDSASDALKKASEAMDGLSQKLDQMADAAADAAQEAMQDAMQDAQEAQGDKPQDPAGQPPPAGQQPPPGSMQNAAKNAQEAANQMKSLADQLAQQAGMPQAPMPGQKSQQKSNQKSQSESQQEGKPGDMKTKQGLPDALKNLGVTDASWFKMKGEMSSGDLDDALKSVPPEYRELVKAYFIELSKEAK